MAKTDLDIHIEASDIRTNSFEVNYSVTTDEELIDLSGSLLPYHTGRDFEYEFEPNWFASAASEAYWDENWETITEEIMEQFSKRK